MNKNEIPNMSSLTSRCSYYALRDVYCDHNVYTALQYGKKLIFFLWRCDPTRVMASAFLWFLDHAQQRITVGRTPLDE
jgi:hypothetical protein